MCERLQKYQKYNASKSNTERKVYSSDGNI